MSRLSTKHVVLGLLIEQPGYGYDLSRRLDERVGFLGVLMAVPDMPAMMHAHEIRSLSRGRLVAPADTPPDGRENVVEFPGTGTERSA